MRSSKFPTCQISNIPKCGYTSNINLLSLFYNKEEFSCFLPGPVRYKRSRNVMKYMGPIDMNKDYLVISRNPYERFLSAYLDKVMCKDKSVPLKWSKEFLKKHNKNNQESVCFEEFIDLFINYKKPDEHFNLQIQQFKTNHKKLTIIDLYDSDKINEYLKNHNINIEYPHNNKNYKGSRINIEYPNLYKLTGTKMRPLINSGKFPDYKNFYNPILKEKVYKLYKKDFDYFKSKGIFYDI